MDAVNLMQPIFYEADIRIGLLRANMRGKLMQGDKTANRIIVKIMDGGKLADLSGMTAEGGFIRPGDAAEIPLEGSIVGNVVSVILSDLCYEAAGSCEINVRLTLGGTTRTILSLVGDVMTNGSGAFVDITGAIPSLEELLAMIEPMRTATENANAAARKIDGMTVSAVSSTTPTASISEKGGVKHITFGIPQSAGEPGGNEVVPWLTGSTADVLPINVKNAIEAQQNVLVWLDDAQLGRLLFMSFIIIVGLHAVIAECVAEVNGYPTALELSGDYESNKWTYTTSRIAKNSEIPAALKSPYAVTFTDASGAVKGTYDGSRAVSIVIPESVESGGDAEAKSEIPDYWMDELNGGVLGITEALMDAGANKSAFLFYTDAHWTNNSHMSPVILRYLYERTGMTKTFFGGDVVDTESSSMEDMMYLTQWRAAVRGLPNHHSAAGNHDKNAGNFTLNDVYGWLLAPEETPEMVRSDNGLYYYVDSPVEKTRYLFLDTGISGYATLDAGQKAFVREALKTTPDKWHIVAIAHKWLDTDYTQTPPVPDGMSDAGTYLLGEFDAYNSRSGAYSDCGGWVEFCVGGHTHWDVTTASGMGIPVLLMETDSEHVRSGLPSALGTVGEASVSGVIADYNNNKIRVVRVGRGEDREVALTWRDTSYTNVLTAAGWTENVRLSISGGFTEKAEADCMLSGFIKVKSGDVIRLRNVEMPPNSSGYQNILYSFDDDKNGVSNTWLTPETGETFAVVVENGNIVQFTVSYHMMDESGSGYIRLNAKAFTSASIITINEPI